MPAGPKELLALVESFPWATWSQEQLGPGYEAIYRDLVRVRGEKAAQALDATWNPKDPYLSRFVTRYTGDRIVQLEGTTKDDVIALVRRVLDEGQGLTSTELGRLVHETVTDHFEDYARYRANTIARTETAFAENHGFLLGTKQAGVDSVDVIDGTDDEECAAANGQVWTIEHALANALGHPNCTRVFTPHAGADDAEE